MRDVNRIPKVLSELGDIWKQLPDWRLGQLLGNFIDYYGDVFYLEDEDFIKELAKYIGTTVKPLKINALEDKIDAMIAEMEIIKDKLKEYK